MPVNSNQKGKRGERELVQQLHKWGFPDARRTQQYNGAAGDSDVVCDDSLPGLHIECKRVGDGASFRPGMELHEEACRQAASDSKGSPWVVLYRPTRARFWSATALDGGLLVTVAGEHVPQFLRRIHAEGVLWTFLPTSPNAPASANRANPAPSGASASVTPCRTQRGIPSNAKQPFAATHG